jgi:FkbM family methyltransferase
VEVGAYDGEYASNTSALADLGWTGYYIEPVPEFFERCRMRHAKNRSVTVSQYAIGVEQGNMQIHVGGPLSTSRDDVKKAFNDLDWAKGYFTGEKILAKQLTLEEYLVEHSVESGFNLLVVDVEGDEWDVFRNFDLGNWMPQMVIVELHDQNDDYIFLREECNNLVSYFDEYGYKVIYKDFSNTICVPKGSFTGLLNSF